MTKTPRTDEQMKLEAFMDGIGIVETVEVEFAQQLETELAEARAEIERKSALIEQMREALKIVKSHMHETGDFYALDDVNAALSAAERGE